MLMQVMNAKHQLRRVKVRTVGGDSAACPFTHVVEKVATTIIVHPEEQLCSALEGNTKTSDKRVVDVLSNPHFCERTFDVVLCHLPFLQDLQRVYLAIAFLDSIDDLKNIHIEPSPRVSKP